MIIKTTIELSDVILTIIFIVLLLLLLSSSLRRWLLTLALGQLQKRMTEQMRRASQEAQAQQARSSESGSSRERQQSTPRREGKLDMSEIEAKRFERPSSDEYVDFEEVK